jgi:hypothetical protein
MAFFPESWPQGRTPYALEGGRMNLANAYGVLPWGQLSGKKATRRHRFSRPELHSFVSLRPESAEEVLIFS